VEEEEAFEEEHESEYVDDDDGGYGAVVVEVANCSIGCCRGSCVSGSEPLLLLLLLDVLHPGEVGEDLRLR